MLQKSRKIKIKKRAYSGFNRHMMEEVAVMKDKKIAKKTNQKLDDLTTKRPTVR